MGRKKYKSDFIDLRGRWSDNEKLVKKIISLASDGKDWTIPIKPLLTTDSYKCVEKSNKYKYPPDLRFARFDDLDLEKIKINNANLTKASLFRTNSNSIKIYNSIAQDTRWNKAILNDAVFENCDLNHSNFSNTQLQKARFINCKMNHTYFRNANLTESIFIKCDLRHSNLNEVIIDNATFNKVKLYGTSLWEIKYNKIKAEGIDLSKGGNEEIITDDIRYAPVIHLLEDDKLVEIINTLKSNTVVILGADNEINKISLLEKIGMKAKKYGYTPIIVKKLKEIKGESFIKKSIMYSLLAKYVIIENSNPSGHILEFNKVLDLGCIVGVLQKEGTGSSWLLEEYFIKYPFHLKKFEYNEDLEDKIDLAYQWCNQQYGKIKEELNKLYKGLNLYKL